MWKDREDPLRGLRKEMARVGGVMKEDLSISFLWDQGQGQGIRKRNFSVLTSASKKAIVF